MNELKNLWLAGVPAPYRLYQTISGQIVEATTQAGATVLIERGDTISPELAVRLAALFDNGLELSLVD